MLAMMRLLALYLLLVCLPCSLSAQKVQWASKLLGVSSEYKDKNSSNRHRFGASQALGRPNIFPKVEFSPLAWSPETPDRRKDEWIKVGFDEPMQIRQVAVCESLGPGTITQIYGYDVHGNEYLLYENLFNGPIEKPVRFLNAIFGLTRFDVAAVKVVLSTIDVPGPQQIDGIAISEDFNPIETGMLIASDMQPSAVESLGNLINTAADEILPVIAPDGNTLFFDRKNHPENIGGAADPNDDIWYCTRQGTGWSAPTNIGRPLNNSEHNYVCSVTPDGNTLLVANTYVTPETSVRTAVSISTRTADGWSLPKPVVIEDDYNDDRYRHAEFCMSNSRRVILMSVQRKDTYGERDLYVSFLKPNGRWTAPKNLGPQVNTIFTELTPFLASDDRTLYFSSWGHGGFGQNDMFVTKRLDDTWTRWSDPMNLGPMLNTSDWDASFTVDAKGEYAYFVSYNGSVAQSADIYRAKLPKDARPQPVMVVSGQVFNAKTREPIAADVLYEIIPDGLEAGKAHTDPGTGSYKITLPLHQRYGVWANAPGFFPLQEETLDLDSIDQYGQLRKDLYLMPIEAGQNIRFNTLRFAQGKSELLDHAAPELDRLAEMMQQMPGMLIELEGHTDIVGSPALNLQLSADRVKVVRQYLIDKGIEDRRIFTKAYGSSRPVTTDRYPGSQAVNRRVEARILSTGMP